jgi:Ca2+-binding EF-hand superfamily protein
MNQPKLEYLIAGMMAAGALAFAPAARAHDKGGAGHEFKMMDTNGDGKVSPEEHAAGAKKMFEMMDADKDGMVNAEEMEAAHDHMMGKKAGKHHPKGQMTAAEKIKVVDADGNGTLSAAEHEAGAKKMFETMDTDKDGFLSKSELAAGHAKLMKKPAK